jgi:hypothetical protein
MPVKLQKIGRRAFSGCASLVSLILPVGCMHIGYDAFENCSSLKRIALPKGMCELEDADIFAGCDALSEISFGGNKEGFSLLTRGEGIRVRKSDLTVFLPKIIFMDLKNEV